jgi:hypothetical protein
MYKNNTMKNGKPWDGYSRENTVPERALLLAVLDQAFKDLRYHLRHTRKIGAVRNLKGENHFYANEAYDWFVYRRYTWLCDLVGVMPEAVEKRFNEIVNEYQSKRKKS